MTATRTAAAVLIATLTIALSRARAGDPVRFPDLAGSYASSVRGGCTLELGKAGNYSLVCAPLRQTHKGQAMVLGNGWVVIFGDESEIGLSEAAISLRADPPSSGAPSDWPPSRRDPTRGPYVVYRPDASDGFILLPLRWGERQYLIRAGEVEAFCRSIGSGLEPRKTAVGDQFLRISDLARTVGARSPAECDAFK